MGALWTPAQRSHGSSGKAAREDEQSLSAILSVIDREPVEDGVAHSAERRVAEAYAADPDGFAAAVQEHFGKPHSRADADFLRLLGRAELGTAAWRAEIIQTCLGSGSVELRDAAAQAAELWDDAAVVEALKAHREPIGWLADYIETIVTEHRNRVA